MPLPKGCTSIEPYPGLKPCPFCGMHAWVRQDGNGAASVRCSGKDCHALVIIRSRKNSSTSNLEQAMQEWNRRVAG